MASSDYIPAELVGYEVISEPGRSRFEWRNQRSFAAIKSDGFVVSWGSIKGTQGDNFYLYSNDLPIQQVFSNRDSFAAVRSDGKVISWGHNGRGAKREKDSLSSDVVRIYSTRRSFSALKSDGSVVSWGKRDEGGDHRDVDNRLDQGVVSMFSTGTSMAALKDDGSVVTWDFHLKILARLFLEAISTRVRLGVATVQMSLIRSVQVWWISSPQGMHLLP